MTEKRNRKQFDLLGDILFRLDINPPYMGFSTGQYFTTCRHFYPIYVPYLLSSIEILFINCLPTDAEPYLMYGADCVYWVLGPLRRVGSPIHVSYVSMSIFFLWFHYRDDCRFVVQAQREIDQFRVVHKSPGIERTVRISKMIVYMCPPFIIVCVAAACLLGFFLFLERNFRYMPFLIISFVYFLLAVYYNTVIIVQSLMRVYLWSKIVADCYRQNNRKAFSQIRSKNKDKLEVFERFYKEFSRISVMYQCFRPQIKQTFVTYACFILPIIGFMFYIAIFRTDIILLVRMVIMCLIVSSGGLACWLAIAIGDVPQSAAEMEGFWFEQLVCERRRTPDNRAPENYKHICAYFSQILAKETGILFLGSQINSSSIISLITIFTTFITAWSVNIEYFLSKN